MDAQIHASTASSANTTLVRILILTAAILALAALSLPNILGALNAGYALAPVLFIIATLCVAAPALAGIAAPAQTNAWFSANTALDLTKTNHLIGLAILLTIFHWVFALNLVFGTALNFEMIYLLQIPAEETFGATPFALMLSVGTNVFFMMVLLLIYAMVVKGVDINGALAEYKLKREGLGRGILFGIAGLIAFFMIYLMINILLIVSGLADTAVTENEAVDSILQIMTVPLALAISLGAAFSEEFFFRGFLQQRLGLWGTAIVFGLAHLSYLNVLQILIPALLGLVLGWLVLKTDNLIAPITVHFFYNFSIMLLGMLALSYGDLSLVSTGF